MARSPDRLPDPHDVVSGKVRPKLEQLVALIHDVNPTDRPLPARERTARYALKSRLQSLLIRHHADVFRVAHAGDGVVSLRHLHSDRDAAHAVLAELDDDARQWAETQLTLAAMPSVPAPMSRGTPRVTEGPNDALSLGCAALDAYDYEKAREHFIAAMRRPPTATDAGRALLELLVDHLADDAGALALEKEFPRALLEEPRTRAILALAAARLGDRVRAQRIARGLGDPGVLAALGEMALRDRDSADAMRLVAALRDADPAHPALVRLRDGLSRVRQEERLPLEAELAALLAEGRLVEAERAAHAITGRWPDSAPARRALSVIERERDQQEARRLAQAAADAYGRGDHRTAASLAERARVLAPADTELVAWLEEAAEAAREAGILAALDLARREAQQGRYGPYLALRDEERAGLRQELGRPALVWLETLSGGPAVLAAVVALEEALVHPERALELLAGHLRLLRPVPVAHQLWAAAEARAASSARGAFETALDAAETAYLEGDLDRAEQLVRGLEAQTATDALRARHADLVALLAADRRRRDAEEQVDQLVQRGALLEARDLARSAGLVDRAGALAEAVRRVVGLEWIDEPDQPLNDVLLPAEQATPACWITGDGARVAFVTVALGYVFVRLVGANDLVANAAWMLRIPGASRGGAAQVDGDLLTVVGEEGWVAQASLQDGELRRILSAPRSRPGRVKAAHLASDGRSLWVTYDLSPPVCAVLDLEDWPRSRQGALPGHAVPLLGEPYVARIVPDGGLMLHALNGARRARSPEITAVQVERVAAAPGGGALIGFGDIGQLAASGYIRAGTGSLARAATTGMFLYRYDHTVRFSGMPQGGRVEVATTRGDNCFTTMHARGSLMLLRVSEYREESGFDRVGETLLPGSSAFVCDAGGTKQLVVSYAESDLMLAGVADRSGRAAGADPAPGAQAGADGPAAGPDAFARGMQEQEANMEALQQRSHLHLSGIVPPFLCAQAEPAEVLSVPVSIANRSLQHIGHLSALDHANLGNLPEARAALARARQLAGACQLDGVEQLLDALEGRGTGVLAEYVHKLQEAHHRMNRKDWAGARDLLDHAWMWRARERQGLARLVACWLEIEPKTGTERFRQRLAFATICGWHAEGIGFDLPLGARTIGPDVWVNVVREARRRLG